LKERSHEWQPRLVLEKLRPEETVTICLPLFLAGGGEERAFAKYYPTITVDGCGEGMCQRLAPNVTAGKPAGSIVVTELTKEFRLFKTALPSKA